MTLAVQGVQAVSGLVFSLHTTKAPSLLTEMRFVSGVQGNVLTFYSYARAFKIYARTHIKLLKLVALPTQKRESARHYWLKCCATRKQTPDTACTPCTERKG